MEILNKLPHNTILYCIVDLGWINSHTAMHHTILGCGFRMDKSLHCTAPRHASNNSPGLTLNYLDLNCGFDQMAPLPQSGTFDARQACRPRPAGLATASIKRDTNFVNPGRQQANVQLPSAQSHLKLRTDLITN